LFPFLPKSQRSSRPPWATIVVLAIVVFLCVLYEWQTGGRGRPPRFGSVERLASPRLAPDAYGRAGDLVLTAPRGASLTMVASLDLPGHRPLAGAIVDLAVEPGDRTDPLMWLRTATVDASQKLKDMGWRSPQPFACRDGGAGLRGYGALGLGLTQEVCALDTGAFFLSTSATSLPEGDGIGDELNVGTIGVVTERGSLVEGEVQTSFVAFGDKGVGALIESPRMRAIRNPLSRFGAEVFPAPVVLRYASDKIATRTLTLFRGDVLDALSGLSTSTRVVDIGFGPDRGGEVSVRDAAGVELGRGRVPRGAQRTIRLPPGLGDSLFFRDDRGVVTDAHVPLPSVAGHTSVTASPGPSGALSLDYKDEAGGQLPVHVLFKGLDGTLDPRPPSAEGRTVRAGRSLYVLDGRTRLRLPVGRYRVTASHGPTYTLAVNDLDVSDGADLRVEGALRRVVDTSAWVSADFHLHSAPSPDSEVTLEERVQSLVCEGIELAVATDHNHVSDFAPSVHALGLTERFASAPGVEITSAGVQRWGHFNAYPIPVPSGAPEEGTPVYYSRLPADMFASARQLGARVVQVNHARMDPGIGYFDLVHLDPKTGRANGEFSSNFDAFEAYNGMWIETREKVREGPRDLVALARRGKRVAALGDSDSHKLLYEEAGWPRTFVHVATEPVATRFDRVVTALLDTRDTTVTSGPFVEMWVAERGVGSVVQAKEGVVHVKVRVSAPAWVPVERVEVWRDDGVFATFPVEGPPKDGVRFERELDVTVDGADRTLLAWAEADAPLPDVLPYAHPLSIGFTGLVYVDANGDGTVTVNEAAP
jgi:hypothetical protein